jgi:hypothetical protein
LKNNKSVDTTTDLEKFKALMQKFKIPIFIEVDEYDCTEIRLKNPHHNTIPLFYFDEEGKFIDVNVALANGQCQVCGAVAIYHRLE